MPRTLLHMLFTSRIAMASAACILALSLGCFGGGVNPRKPREFVFDHLAPVPEAFQQYDLPWYGGQIERQTPTSMAVSYSSLDGITKEWLVEQWTASLEAEGWVEYTRTESGNGDVSVIYDLPNGQPASMSVRNHAHLVWWVTIHLPNQASP